MTSLNVAKKEKNLNFFYSEYPYGSAEAFVEYEMRELELNGINEITIFTLRNNKTNEKRFVPKNTKIIPMVCNSSFKVFLKTILKLFSKRAIKEIFYVLKSKQKEGTLRCLYRIYRYINVSIIFNMQYNSLGRNSGADTFVSYWLNECAFALTELKRKYPDIKIASRGHGYDVFEERCYMPFRKEILSLLDKVFLINNTSKLYFEERYGEWLDMSKIEISHLGVDLPENNKEFHFSDTFRIVTCSSLIPLKRIDLMINALSQIKNKKIEWVHFGDGPLLDQMKSYAEQKLSESCVNYVFKGQVPLKEIHNYYANTPINLFVNCSDTEGTPVSIMEAMSYGIPVVARNVGGNNEVVDDSCGILLDKEDNATLLKGAIEKIFDMETEKYLYLRTNSQNKINNEFNAAKTFKNYIEKIKSL